MRKEVFIISDDDGNAIVAPTWCAAVRGWADRWKIKNSTQVDWSPDKTIVKEFGENWIEELTNRGSRFFNDFFDCFYYANIVPYYGD